MQAVFEKIIEKLEDKRKKAELLIMENPQDELDRIQTQTAEDFATAYKGAIEIVKQEAEQYNNGWISCSEQLPELETEVLIYTEQGGMTIASLTKPDIFWEDEEGNILIGVIAWHPLPEPYQPKGE